MRSRIPFTLFCCLFSAPLACSSESDLPFDGADSGGSGSGGGTSSGGAASGSGGSLSTGGQSSSGGGTASGGSLGSGGDTSTGGGEGPASGGEAASGGQESSGGMTGSGGATETGNLSPGCSVSLSNRPDPRQQQTITVGNLTRYYLMYVPQGLVPGEPLPLVFGIHGLNMNNVWAAHDDSGFKLIDATDDQALLIYPQGIRADGTSVMPSTESQWGTADSNWGGPPPTANQARLDADLAFFDAMIEFVSENYCVDLDRVYSVGFSQGGFMTNTLGCERASVFRALAPVAGWGPNASNPTCDDAQAAHAVIQTQGDTDTTVTPQLGQSTRDFWRGRAGCEATTSPSSFGQGCLEYQGCDDDKPVVYCTHGGGHSVPGEAGPRAWDFFQSLE